VDAPPVKLEEGAAPISAAAPPGAPGSPSRVELGLVIDGRVTISPGTAAGAPHVTFEWISDTVSDMVADAARATVLSLEGPSEALLAAEAAHAAAAAGTDAARAAEWRLFAAMLQAQFGGAVLDEAAACISLGGAMDAEGVDADAAVARGEAPVLVMLRTGTVVCPRDDGRRARVEKAMERFGAAILPVHLPSAEEELS
jgi:hypothetical protein